MPILRTSFSNSYFKVKKSHNFAIHRYKQLGRLKNGKDPVTKGVIKAKCMQNGNKKNYNQ